MVAEARNGRVHCTGPYLAAFPNKRKPRGVSAGLPVQRRVRLLGRFVLVFCRVGASLVFRALVLGRFGILIGRRFVRAVLRPSGLFGFFGFLGLCFFLGRFGVRGFLGFVVLCFFLGSLALVGLAHGRRRGRCCRGGRCRRRSGRGCRFCRLGFAGCRRFRRLRFGRRRGGRGGRHAGHGDLILDLGELAFLDSLDLHDIG